MSNINKPFHLFTALTLNLLVFGSCSDVQLNYGAPLSGLVNLSERNRNANNPNIQENFEQQRVPVPSPTPNDRGIGDGGSTGPAGAGKTTTLPPVATIPEKTPPEAPVKGVSDIVPSLKLRAIPGRIELSGFGSEQPIQLLLQDLNGNNLDLTKYEFNWESLSPSLISVDNKGVIRSKTTSGSYKVVVSLKSDPAVKAEIEVVISAPSSGGGGGGGGGGAPPAGGGGAPAGNTVLVTALSVAQGSVTESVTLTVSGFNPQTSAATVTFAGGVQATVTGTTANTVTVTIPQGAITGSIGVSSAEGTASSTTFTIVPKDNVTGVVIFQ